MERYDDSNQSGNQHDEELQDTQTTRFGFLSERVLLFSVVALIGIAIIAFAYGYHQQTAVRQLAAQATASDLAVKSLQSQITALTSKLNEANATQVKADQAGVQDAALPAPDGAALNSELSPVVPAQTPESSTGAAKAPPSKPHTKRAVAKHRPAVDTKYQQLQAQLADQQKQLKATQDEVEKNRTDLEGTLNSTRDDLNSSIARTHEELVTLEKRGERSYFEFDLSKSKQFQRIGPVTISLRKADTKHKSYDLAMVVDDNELQKKKVNLYEPVWIHAENESQPIQIVVNKIEKDSVHGYVSSPKYKASELSAPASSAVTPTSNKPSTTTSSSPTQP